LVFSGFNDGICFDGYPHQVAMSGNYFVAYESTPPGTQPGWRWCSRCQALVFSGFTDVGCFEGQRHELSDSGAYSVPYESTPPGTQPGWRWCSRCQVLVFSGFDNGYCFNAAPHELSDSGAYSVPYGHPLLKLDVAEEGRTIVVTGEGYTATGQVHLAYIKGPKVAKFDWVANADGGFVHRLGNAIDRGPHGGCLVIARDESTSNFAAGETQRLLPDQLTEGIVIDHPEDGLIPED
jgi:hypothetical protein